jgi:hypothetical protein
VPETTIKPRVFRESEPSNQSRGNISSDNLYTGRHLNSTKIDDNQNVEDMFSVENDIVCEARGKRKAKYINITLH